ncbi:hypothetical protein H0H93_016515, partial [Arthromyces matolae]
NYNSSLTDELKAEYKAANKCYNCGGEGHFARNCPRKSNGKGSSSKPPGLKSHSIRIDLDEVDRLREEALAETTEGLFLGALRVEEEDDDDIPDLQSVSDSECDQEDDDDVPDMESVSDNHESEYCDNEDHYPVFDYDRRTLFMDERGVAHFRVPGPDEDPDDLDDVCEPVALTDPVDLGADQYDFTINYGEERIDILEKEERNRGRPDRLGSPAARKLEYLLESMQPYPGDPSNCMQYKGQRFMSYDISDTQVCLYDMVRTEDHVLEKEDIL